MQVFNSFQEMGLATGALSAPSSMSVFNISAEEKGQLRSQLQDTMKAIKDFESQVKVQLPIFWETSKFEDVSRQAYVKLHDLEETVDSVEEGYDVRQDTALGDYVRRGLK